MSDVGGACPFIPELPLSDTFVFVIWLFHLNHQLFSRLENHSTVSLFVLVTRYILVLISSNLINCIPGCINKDKGVVEMALVLG